MRERAIVDAALVLKDLSYKIAVRVVPPSNEFPCETPRYPRPEWYEAMIIGTSFVWLHFPKCAGTTTAFTLLQNFNADSSIAFDATGKGDPIWHDTVAERERRSNVSLRGKNILANIRRLPAYVVSKIHYTESLNPEINHAQEHFVTGQFMESNGFSNSADNLLKHYEANNVEQWLRTEHLQEDFVSVFSRYLNLEGKDLSALSQKINANDYTEDLAKRYSRQELERLYRNCPLWAELERRVYGNLLIEEMY